MNKLPDPRFKCASALRELAPMLTPDDRREAATTIGVHPNTVNNYLTGKVGDIEIGLQMLEFFNGRVKARLSRVRQILAA